MNRQTLDDKALDTLFRQARTYNNFTDQDVSDALLQAVFDLAKMGPTSANCCPARFIFVKSKEGKERLRPHMDQGNLDKTMKAPVTVIFANDLEFYEQLPKLFPHTDARSWFAGNDALIKATAFRNGTLQAAYFMLAARSLGLDCGPMSGFNQKGVKDEFFPDQNVEVNFVCNLGYGTQEGIFPRSPRFEFGDICKVV